MMYVFKNLGELAQHLRKRCLHIEQQLDRDLHTQHIRSKLTSNERKHLDPAQWTNQERRT